MIIETVEELAQVTEPVTMVDGGFDPLHQGHVAYFVAAATLGLPVLCAISPDDYVATKHPVLLAQPKRAFVIDHLRPIAYTYLNNESTAEALRRIRPKYYAKGKDWEERGLPEAETAICAELGIEIRYLDTMLDSSSRLMKAFKEG